MSAPDEPNAKICRAIELIYLMCELESSVVFVDHAARVFKEASENFEELKLRIQDQLRFQSYIEACPQGCPDNFQSSQALEQLSDFAYRVALQESQVDHLSIAWEVPSFKQDYSRNVPEEGTVALFEIGGITSLLVTRDR